MLLIARPLYGRQVECWATGGENKVINVPTPPHFFSTQERVDGRKVTKILLSTLQKVTLWRVDLNDRRDIYSLRDQHSLETDVPYMHVLHNLHGWMQKDTDALHGAFDIEAPSTGQFPNPKHDPLNAIAYYSPKHQVALTGKESLIIKDFRDLIVEENPDIIDHYNGGRFDFPYVLERAHIHDIKLNIDRKGKEPTIHRRVYKSGYRKGVDYTVYMHGRISFDVWKEARFDTSLTGQVKNKRLKTVGKYFFGDKYVVEEDRSKIGDLTDKQVAKYCFSDARLTWLLADHYLMLLKHLAYMLKVPLDFIIHRSPSHIGNTIYGRRFKKLDIVSDGANLDRFKGVLWK